MRIPFPLRSGKYDLRHDSEFELQAGASNFRPGPGPGPDPDPGDDDDDDWGLGTGNLANLRTQNSSGHVLRMEPTTESHNLLQQNAFSDENYDDDLNDITDKLAKYKIGM